MKRMIKYALVSAAAAAAAAGTAAFLIAPGRADTAAKRPFLGAYVAHRGLHRADRSVPENSLTAFRAAAERGYGVELDVRMTADGRLVVFHDVGLQRVCGVSGRIEKMTWAELANLTMYGTEEHIPLFSEALEAIGGGGPLVVELKHAPRYRRMCRLVRAALLDYPGDYCVQSFDPVILRWWRKNAPEVLRGQLSRPARGLRREMGEPGAYILSRLLTNFLSRPQFISWSLEGKKPLTVRLCERMGAMRVAWTSRASGDAAGSDAVIFEYYLPEPVFRAAYEEVSV